jgi:hypothetical protein
MGFEIMDIRLSGYQREGYQDISRSGRTNNLISCLPDIHFLIFWYPDILIEGYGNADY